MPEEETTENTDLLENTDLDMEQTEELIELAKDKLDDETTNGEQQ